MQGCLFFAVKPPKDTCTKLSGLQKSPRGRDMSYLVGVETRWHYVRVYNDVRGKNIATIPHTGVLKRYRSPTNNQTIVRVVPLTTRTGCTSSWRHVKIDDPNRGRFPHNHAPTVLSVTGTARGCGAVDVALYGTGQPAEELANLTAKVQKHIQGMDLTELAEDSEAKDGEVPITPRLRERLADSDDITIKEKLICSISLSRPSARKAKGKAAAKDDDDSDDDAEDASPVHFNAHSLSRAASSMSNSFYEMLDRAVDPWCSLGHDDAAPVDSPADKTLSPSRAPADKRV